MSAGMVWDDNGAQLCVIRKSESTGSVQDLIAAVQNHCSVGVDPKSGYPVVDNH
jgi:hypothetical protein